MRIHSGIVVALGLLLHQASITAGEFQAEVSRQGIQIREGGRPVLFYQTATKSRDGKFSRANYVHPLFDLDGKVITEDFPDDHRHHRGVFWAWHQVRVGKQKLGDAWVCDRFEWNVTHASAKLHKGRATITSRVAWKSPDWKPKKGSTAAILEEHVRIEIHPATSSFRLIDFVIKLQPLRKDVWIGGSENAKGYGGFSARIRLPKDVAFAGKAGAVTPVITAVEAGPWINITGRINGKTPGGLAILGHPSLPGHPQPWILRRRGSMQNARYPGRHAVLLPHRDPVVLKYRLVVHRGDLGTGKLNELQGDWSKSR